jgi:hypothetical protein
MFCFLCSGNFLFFLFVSFIPYFLSLCFYLQNASSCLLLFYYYVFFRPLAPHAHISIWPSIFNQSFYPLYPSVEDSFLSNMYVLIYILSLSFVVCTVSLYFCFCIQNHVLSSVTPTISKCVCIVVSGSG